MSPSDEAKGSEADTYTPVATHEKGNEHPFGSGETPCQLRVADGVVSVDFEVLETLICESFGTFKLRETDQAGPEGKKR